MMVIHLRGIGEVFNMLDSIMAEYSQFEQTGDLLLGLKIMQDATAARELLSPTDRKHPCLRINACALQALKQSTSR